MDVALLDTDMLSEVLKQRNPQIVAKAAAYLRSHGSFAFSAFTRFEIARGFKEKGATNQLTRFREFCQHSLIIPATDLVFDRAEDLWAIARRGGLHAFQCKSTPRNLELRLTASDGKVTSSLSLDSDRPLICISTVRNIYRDPAKPHQPCGKQPATTLDANQAFRTSALPRLARFCTF